MADNLQTENRANRKKSDIAEQPLVQPTAVIKPVREEENEFWNVALHDLRSPLTIIIGSAQFLQSRTKGEDQGLAQMILRSSQNMLELLSDILSIQNIESGMLSLERQAQDLLPILQRSLVDYRLIARGKNIEIEYKEGTDSALALVDEDRIKEVFDNLLSNAVKYSYPDTKIGVSTAVAGGYVQISVRDQGIGIRQDEIDKVFTKLAKISNRPTADELSTGLGLAIVKKLLELHDGDVTVSSLHGKGTTFTVALPILQEAPEPIAQQETSPIVPVGSDWERLSAKNSMTALLIDDSQGIRRVLAPMLEGLGLEIVGEAFDGKTGLARYKELKPDVVFLDVVMPLMSGLEVLVAIKETEPDAIVVMLTSMVSREKILASKKAGAFAYLLKPFESYKVEKVIGEIKTLAREERKSI